MSTSRKAFLQVFGKGFKVTADTEEFQRLVPKRDTDLHLGLEKALQTFSGWGSLLEPLYGLTPRDAGSQFCLLLDDDSIMSVSVALTEDRHARPSVVVVAATTKISWDDTELPQLFERCVALSYRMALELASAFRKNHERNAAQLERGTFVRDRIVELTQEPPAAVTRDWPSIVGEIRAWQGVRGLATTRMASLGANVVIGTRHEAEKANALGAVDGYYDIRMRQIVPLSEGLKRWIRQAAEIGKPTKTLEPIGAANAASLESIDMSLKRIDGSLQKLTHSVDSLLRSVLGLILRDGRNQSNGSEGDDPRS